ncbi:unnamed protein product [Rhizoctonia solani]|uniref:CHAT domain-containing protein n=1 Tax=Rhizoctonia solani TaxID=456999 RepID=A0A8H3AKL6_9AGAM|nr:unnamed protein product [Rhizoctonia solani]
MAPTRKYQTDAFVMQRLGELSDMEWSIEYNTRALDSTSSDDPALPGRLMSLGASGNYPALPGRLASLGSSHYLRFQRLSEPSDLKNAIEFFAPRAQLSGFQYTGDASILQHSLGSFRLASQSSTATPRAKFEYALDWATHASSYSPLNCIEAYQTAIDLLPQFIWLGATTSQRYQDLLIAEGLAVKAASAAILSSDHSLAITWLEHARCVVWNQSLMLRSPLDYLCSSQPDLAIRLQTVAKQLHEAGFESSTPQTLSLDSLTVSPEQHAQRRRRLAKEYSDLLAQVQAIDGFANLLRPLHATDLIRAARYGPVVILNCYKAHCAALLIIPGRENVAHIPLPYCNEEKVQEARLALVRSLRSKGIRERGFKPFQRPGQKDKTQSMLLTLWMTIVKPVLDFLGYLSDAPATSLPHITWCPTGPMSFLPLHAAGDYNQPRSRVFDYVISSYTPTLTALLASTSNTLSRTTRILAIGQAMTPGRSPLPGTATELEHVRAHADKKVEYSQLIDDQATVATALDAMDQHDWVHLACHAHQNVQDPTKSGFFLHDGTLDLASINRRSFSSKGLAFLSACQTATGDEKLPDEAIHLASGMLMAGYSSVIGTMWSVSDSDAPFVADKVYAELMKDGKVGNGEAGKALHHAVAALREQIGEKNFGRWVPYIHIGS